MREGRRRWEVGNEGGEEEMGGGEMKQTFIVFTSL